MEIQTARLQLISCNLEILSAIFSGDDEIAKLLKVNLPQRWTENGEPAFSWTKKHLEEFPNDEHWFTYLHILKEGKILNGTCGFKGPPCENGSVELGYEVAAQNRNLGFATEITKALIGFAFSHSEVKKIIAHTLAEKNSSGRVLTKNGFTKTAEVEDAEDGLIWRWELSRP